mgnify:CR=1 FL=1
MSSCSGPNGEEDVVAACREERCPRIAEHPQHPEDFRRRERIAAEPFVECPACRGACPAACTFCGGIGKVKRRRAFHYLRMMRR